MTDRVIRVRLIAEAQGLIAGFDQASKKTRELGSETERLAQKKSAFDTLGRGALAFGVASGAAAGLAVAKFADFDRAMSNVQAATQESVANMRLLREAALEAGSETVYTASEAANAIEELGKNGLSTAQILAGGLDSALALAAAGQLEVGRAAEIASITMKQFKLEGEDLPHVADLLAAGAGKAAGDVEDLAQALNQAALVAGQTGLSVEDTTGVLSAFADAGLLGSDAGTSFRSMLQRLTPLSGEAADEMKRLGINAFDAGGEFVGIERFAGILQSRLRGLSDEQRSFALAQIFGSDAVRAANVLYEQGADGIANYIKQTDDAGYAAQVAADRLDNLSGDVEKLGGAFDTALIQSGSGANDALRALTQTATGVVDGFASLPEPMQQGTVALLAIAAGAALVGGGFLTLVPKVAAARASLAAMNVTAGGLARGIGKGGAVLAALSVLTVGLSGMGQEAQLASDDLSKLNASFKTMDIGSLDAQFDTGRRGAKGFQAALEQLYTGDFGQSEAGNLGFAKFVAGLGFGDFEKKLRETETQFKELGRTLATTASTDFAAANDQFQKLVELGGGGETAVRRLLNAMPEYVASLRDLAAQQGVTLSDQDLLNLAMGKGTIAAQLSRDAAARNAVELEAMGSSASAAATEVDGLADKIRGFGDLTLNARAAERDFRAAIDEATASIAANGQTLNLSTAQGRANEIALDAIARAAKENAAAVYEQTQSQSAATDALARGRTALLEQLAALGITGAEAEAYADSLKLIPSYVGTIAQLDTTPARTAMKLLIDDLSGQRVVITAEGRTLSGGLTARANGGLDVYAFAGGGFATGIYAGRAGGIHKFAEPETRWEAYISGKPGQERRNLGIWAEAGARLGAWQGAGSSSSSGGRSGAGGGVNVIVSSKGGIDLLKYIDVAIEKYDTEQRDELAAGFRRD